MNCDYKKSKIHNKREGKLSEKMLFNELFVGSDKKSINTLVNKNPTL